MTSTLIRSNLDLEGVVLGVDTHADTHHAAVIDAGGALLGDAQFTADTDGYARLLQWARGFGPLTVAGVEQTGSYGAGLVRVLRDGEVTVVEVNAPVPAVRASRGKTDALDAYQAALAVLSGRAAAVAKTRDGALEELRVLMCARSSATDARQDATGQIRDLIVTAPEPLRERLRALTGHARVRACAELTSRDALARTLQRLAERVLGLEREIAEYDRELDQLTQVHFPDARAMRQVGPIGAAQLAITYGGHGRIHSEAAFARLTGVAPIPVASGKTNRVRLHRGGDRHANRALHMIVIGRLQNDPDTRAYIERCLARGKTKKEAIRLLKRYLARSIYRALTKDFERLDNL